MKLKVSPNELTKDYLITVARSCKADVGVGSTKQEIIEKLQQKGVVFPRSRIIIPAPKISAYNEFMREELHRIHKSTKGAVEPREAFRRAARAYQSQKKKNERSGIKK